MLDPYDYATHTPLKVLGQFVLVSVALYFAPSIYFQVMYWIGQLLH